MTSGNNPWSDIPVASQGVISKLRVSPDCVHSIYWFRDDQGLFGLLVEIDNSISGHILNKARINIRGIQIDAVEVQDQHFRALTIKLEEQQNRDVFLKLCMDLIECVNRCHKHEDVFHAVCARLKKWQSLLSGKSKSLLTSREIQGLYAELCFVSACLDYKSFIKPYGKIDIIRGWEGPEDGQHDFVLGDHAVEIKSIAGNQRNKVRISSEDQLYTHLGALFLRIYYLSEANEIEAGESLNEIVERITRTIEDHEVRALFETKLALARYIDISDYDYPKFNIKDIRTYAVENNFPRITPDAVPDAVEAVAYDLVLAGVEQFRTEKDILEKL